MKVRYTEAALAEIDDILSYVAKENPLAADEVSAILDATIARLADYPLLAVETNVQDVRMIPVLPYRYILFYSLQHDTIIIRNMRHSARKDYTL